MAAELNRWPRVWKAGYLSVSDGHMIWWAEVGDNSGTPLIVLHGGPGSGTSTALAQIFDGLPVRVILVDQRGSGRSTPTGSLVGNTTEALVGDLEHLRQTLEIDQWIVFGASWGAVLALHYAMAHPTRCLALQLHAVFVPDIDWIEWRFFGVRHLMPERWQAFNDAFAGSSKGQSVNPGFRLMSNCAEALAASNPTRSQALLPYWLDYMVSPKQRAGLTEVKLLSMARIQLHYMRNLCFTEATVFLNGLDKLRSHPIAISHGSEDIVCMPESAARIAKCLNSDLIIVPGAGHSHRDPASRAVIRDTLRF